MSIHQSRRSFLKSSMKASLMAGTAAAFLPTLVKALGNIPSELPTGKSIYELRGKVTVDGKQATMDTLITAESTIITGSNSYIIFVVGKDAHILRENSEMNLSGSGVIESSMRLITGKILSVFGERSDDEPTLQINTSTATIGIRGTAVYAESWKDASYLCTCYGNTFIQSQADPSVTEEVKTQHHDAPRIIYKKPKGGKLIVPAGVFNHTDEELMLLEAIVGREVPFSAVQSYGGPRRSY